MIRLAVPLLLVACASDEVIPESAASFPVDAAAPPAPPLVLSGLSGGLALGAHWEVEVDGAYFNEEILLLESSGGEGAGPCPPRLGGECLDVARPVQIASTGRGDATRTALIPYTADQTGQLCLQAVAIRGTRGQASQVSNVVCVEVYDPNASQASCGAWADAGATASGTYLLLPPGAALPFEVECDLTDNGGRWTRFWWHTPGTPFDGTDALGDTLSACDVAGATCYARLPDTTATQLRVETERGEYGIWNINDASTTAARFRGAFFNGTTAAFTTSSGGGWNPVEENASPWSSCGGSCTTFWYDTRPSGIRSFNLDEDGHWGQTAFAAGTDEPEASPVGVDGLTATAVDRHVSPNNGLWLWYR